MQELLYLTHRIPYPPNKGDKIRSYHLLKHLSQKYKVHLGTFVDADEDWQYVDHVKEFCSETCFIPLNPKLARLRCLTGLATNQPLTLPYYWNAQLQEWVNKLLATKTIHEVFVFSSAMAQYVRQAQSIHRIIDFVDIDSDKWRQYADTKSWPVSWIYRRESRLLQKYEKLITQEFDSATFVSKKEADLFKNMFPEVSDKVDYFNNGVDINYFSPLHDSVNPYSKKDLVLVFTGAMDYWANVDAVEWFARSIFPAIRTKLPDLKFFIVGSNPTKHVLALSTISGVEVTGSVPDVRPYLKHASLAIMPLRIARGIQNKVLEAMAMEKIVVASPQAMEGICAKTGQELYIANNEIEYVNLIVKLIEDDSEKANFIGQAARVRILSDYTWQESLARIDTLLS
jgi:sugar transferase (PEP-CTERM/EpsH1 system associated)